MPTVERFTELLTRFNNATTPPNADRSTWQPPTGSPKVSPEQFTAETGKTPPPQILALHNAAEQLTFPHPQFPLFGGSTYVFTEEGTWEIAEGWGIGEPEQGRWMERGAELNPHGDFFAFASYGAEADQFLLVEQTNEVLLLITDIGLCRAGSTLENWALFLVNMAERGYYQYSTRSLEFQFVEDAWSDPETMALAQRYGIDSWRF